MKIFTFWEQSPFLEKVPPYILCALVTMRTTFKESFLILNKNNLDTWIDFNFKDKLFYFSASTEENKDVLSKIVAKSDFIRMYFVYKHGGMWVDADTIILSNFIGKIYEMLYDKLVWHSEQLFGALSGNELIKAAADNMINSERQIFGNPGNIKDIVQQNKDKIYFIPSKIWDPRLDASYNAKNWNFMTRKDVSVEDFIINKDCGLVKIYNSELGKLSFAQISVEEFLELDILLSRIFLYICPDIKFWTDQTAELEKILNS